MITLEKFGVFSLKTKYQVLDAFKELHTILERETVRKLKAVKADNGGEYGGPFENYCKLHGIRLEKTVPKTPQQNGVAERMNRTIEERIRCMLSHSNLPTSFWGETMRTSIDLINLSPSVPLKGDVPERLWTGKDVSYDNLRVFGCKAFVHIPKDERSKLDVKAKPCIFLGYGHEEFGYRLWDPLSRKIVRSRDVVFLEDQLVDDGDKVEKSSSSAEIPIRIDPVVPPTVFANHEGELQEGDGVIENEDDPIVDNVEPTEQVDGELPLPPYEPPLRRSTREPQPSTRYPPNEYVMLTNVGEPETYQEAILHESKKEWVKAIQEEVRSLLDNHTYDLVKLPQEKKALRNKWVYRLKTENNGSQPKEICMQEPEGFEVKGKENIVCKLKKSLYGLKQAPRQWYKKFDSFMMSHGYNRTSSDHCVFTRKFSDDDFIILLLYVDDMLIIGHDSSKIDRLKRELSKSFSMKDLGSAKQILGMKISCDRKNRKLWLS